MCGLHDQRWERAGRPDLEAWLAEPQPFKRPAAGATCRIPHCELWPQATSPFCHTHTNTWKVNGRTDIDEFAGRFATITPLAGEVIRLDRLTGQLKLEMQYVLQRRHDDRQGKLTPDWSCVRCGHSSTRAWARCSTTTKTTGSSELGRRSTTLAPAGSSVTPAG